MIYEDSPRGMEGGMIEKEYYCAKCDKYWYEYKVEQCDACQEVVCPRCCYRGVFGRVYCNKDCAEQDDTLSHCDDCNKLVPIDALISHCGERICYNCYSIRRNNNYSLFEGEQ